MASSERPKKLQRISQACDLCHRRSIRCRPSTENPQHQCQNCYDFAVDCTYKRPSRRRRNQSLPQVSPPNLLPSQQQPSSPGVKLEGSNGPSNGILLSGNSADFTGAFETVREGRPEELLGVAWRSFAAASGTTIERYLEVYMEFIYPLFPLFHGPTLWERVRRRHHLTDRAFFASVMAACALAAARARDGATGDKYQFDESAAKSSEMFFSAAQDAIFKDLTKATGIGYMRACALLAVTSIQYGQLQTMHHYIGTFMTLSAIQQFHDEDKWPQNLTMVEREERRRLFWSMYTLDIYAGAVFGSILRSQETHSNVRYPNEISDEQISADSASPSEELHWMRGWNFTTDLYRILEHTLKRLRRNKQRRDDRTSVVRLLIADSIPDVQVMENILNLYYQLPPRFKEYQVGVTGDKSQDVFGFQAANIQATLQLLRIILFESSNWHDVDQKCEVAESVLSSFQSISPHYLRAISTPLVYHLGGIGQILAGVMQGILTEDKYQRVVSLLGSMADVLEGLESGLQPAAGASKGIRAQIDKIDQFMNVQRQMLASFPQTNSSLDAMPEIAITNGLSSGNNLALPTNNLGMQTPLDEFQLPGDLTGGWPWPFDFTQDGGAQILSGFSEEHR